MRTMLHPYTGELVKCAEYDGTQHDDKHAYSATRWEQCDNCYGHFEECLTCHSVISCCYCGLYHAWECPWPL